MRWFVAVLLALLAAPCSWAMDEELERVLQSQGVRFHVEGQVLGDMVIGSRGTVEVIWVNRRLAEALSRAQFPPQWLVDQVQKLDSVPRGHSLFAVAVRANKPFTVDLNRLIIGVPLRRELLLTREDRMLTELSSGEESFFGVLAPVTVKPGSSIPVGYGEDRAELKVSR